MSNFKQPKIRSKKHLAFVRSQACIISGQKGQAIIAHHLLRAGGKAMGVKACDSLTVPLVGVVHDALHRNGNEIAFFAKHGLDYETVKEIAIKLSSESPCAEIRNLTKGE